LGTCPFGHASVPDQQLRSILRIGSYVVLAEAERLASEEGADEFVPARACMYAMHSMHTAAATDGPIGIALLSTGDIRVHREGGPHLLLYLGIFSHGLLRMLSVVDIPSQSVSTDRRQIARGKLR
jgi:hypothetical protein